MEIITVGVGDCAISSRRDTRLVTHALGSCIAVIVHDPVVPVGGLLHFLLPVSGLDPQRAHQEPCLFADTGLQELLRRMTIAGADLRRVSVRLAGGALVMDPKGLFQIGRKNYEACHRALAEAGLSVQNEEVGGTISRTVRLDVGSGELWWSTGCGEWTELPVQLGGMTWRGPVTAG